MQHIQFNGNAEIVVELAKKTVDTSVKHAIVNT